MNQQDRRAYVVEDDPDIRALLVEVLTQAGFSVEATGSGRDALAKVPHVQPDLVTLDLGLPDLDGVEVCRQLRAAGSDAYVIMLTARDEEVDRLIGLEIGADDYLSKPFSPRELRARAMAMLRRPRRVVQPSDHAANLLRLGTLQVDVDARTVVLDGAELELTRTEFDLLVTLLSNPRRVWTRETLLNRVWGSDWSRDTHLVEVHIGNLRRKLGDGSRSGRWIRTVRGVGYRLGPGT
ncbi:MAG TPA: response regulator transcription factor [Jatrophihabitans sp.]|nr:response regulator transcription factor [Jatrophihabitans sp.]